jgi:Mn-containing catalase
MKKNKFMIPALVFGLMVIGSSAYAYGGGASVTDVFKNFTPEQQAAIQKAQDIRQAADKEAKDVLDAAGVDMKAMHDAMMMYQQAQREKMDTILENDDYTAFLDAIENTPMTGTLTEEDFNKMVQAHKLMKSGDKAGAMKVLQDAGIKGPFMGFGGRFHALPIGDTNQ